MTETNSSSTKGGTYRAKPFRIKKRVLFVVAPLILVLGSFSAWRIASMEPPPIEPPETARILQAQESTGNFGIMIPAYLPKGFDRANVEIAVEKDGPAGEPSVSLAYRNPKGASLYFRQWVPANPELETLAGSRPIETKWGKGWLLTQTKRLIAIWVDVGVVRVSISTINLDTVSREQLVLIADTLGLASNLQTYSFVTELPKIKNIQPPPPFEVPLNAQGVQELNLTITPGGYSPMRFAIKKDIPVKLNFRALGQVGCGSVMLLPVEPNNYQALEVTKDRLVSTVEFTPKDAGEFRFNCASDHYRGIMTVR